MSNFKFSNLFKKIKYLMEKFSRHFLMLGIVVVLFLLAFQFGILSIGPRLQNINLLKLRTTEAKEIKEIKATTNIGEQAKLYKKLIERVGPAEAQEDLFKSGLPFSGQTHLLNHTVGDYLYKKFGPAGLLQCKDYFLSSCYHGFVLQVIGNKGMDGVIETFNECLKFGPSVYAQCAHAIGHGFLANIGYKDLVGALQTCDKVGQNIKEFPLFNCYDGVFMENIWAVHEGAPSPDRWVHPGDVVYPCNDKRIDDKYLLGCWSNQPALAYQLFKGDIKKVADVCSRVSNQKYHIMCFDGLARQIHPLTKGEVKKVFELCGLISGSRWINLCVSVNASSSYAVGDRSSPFEICANVSEGGKQSCYDRLFSTMKAYAQPNQKMKNLCSKVQDAEWRQKCENSFR